MTEPAIHGRCPYNPETSPLAPQKRCELNCVQSFAALTLGYFYPQFRFENLSKINFESHFFKIKNNDMKKEKTYCVNKNCPNRKCENHIRNVPKGTKYISIAALDGVCRWYLYYLLELIEKEKQPE